jgi:regulatory protein
MQPKSRWKKRSTSLKGFTNEPHSKWPDNALYDFALKELNRRPYPTVELEKRLLNRSDDKALIASIIQKLTRYGYLNDRKYIEFFAESGREQKFFSRSRIEAELAARGLDPQLVVAVLEEIYPRADDSIQLTRAMERKLKKFAPPMDEKKVVKLYNYLVREGFSEESVQQELRRRLKSDLNF